MSEEVFWSWRVEREWVRVESWDCRAVRARCVFWRSARREEIRSSAFCEGESIGGFPLGVEEREGGIAGEEEVPCSVALVVVAEGRFALAAAAAAVRSARRVSVACIRSMDACSERSGEKTHRHLYTVCELSRAHRGGRGLRSIVPASLS